MSGETGREWGSEERGKKMEWASTDEAEVATKEGKKDRNFPRDANVLSEGADKHCPTSPRETIR